MEEKINSLSENHSTPKDILSVCAQLIEHDKPIYKGRVCQDKIVTEIRLKSERGDIVGYASYIVGPEFNNLDIKQKKSLWGIVEQQAALNLLYNVADEKERHAFLQGPSRPGQSSRQLQTISYSNQIKMKARQDKHIDDQEASYIFFDIERPSGDQSRLSCRAL